ncbi:MAG: NAD(P)-dependent oxidoreductase, partial [Lachnospirales bacterium]
PLTELSGKTMGLIGYGSIGKEVGKIALSFGMNVIYYRPRGKCKDDNSKCKYESLEKVLSESDIISLHCPLNDETKEIINSNTISLMKKGVIIINTARGGVINDKDVCEALEKGKISYYLCDVVNSEPPKKDNPIIMAKNTIVTPHIAWQAVETKKRLLSIAFSNLEGFINGRIINKVS